MRAIRRSSLFFLLAVSFLLTALPLFGQYVQATITVGSNPVAISVNPASNKIYVANEYDNTVSVIDGNSNSTTTKSVQDRPDALAANPATGKICVANSSDKLVSVLSGAGQKLVQVDSTPDAVAVNPVTNRIYVANQYGYTVSVIDGGGDKVMTAVKTGYYPSAIAVNQSTNKIYVANDYYTGTVTVIDGPRIAPRPSTLEANLWILPSTR
jgi:YVTN family beta-propeller protein